MPKHALIVMDNAPYHPVLSRHAAPTATCKKDEIRSWLSKHRIPVRDDCRKAALVEMLAKVAPAPTYALDARASEQGHEIFRTPPSHPELQPIATCWAVVKNQIARKSKCTMAYLLEQLDDAFDSGTEETCSGLIKKVREVEDK
jgi:transposase